MHIERERMRVLRKWGGRGGGVWANMNVRLELVKEFSICSVGNRLNKHALSQQSNELCYAFQFVCASLQLEDILAH
jgi:hypothetical protein